MSEEFNPFQLSSGLPLADVDATVKSIEFGYDAEYMKGEACVAIITFETEDGNEARQLYSVGKMFEPAERGEQLVHTSGKNVNLNNQSNYGRFIDALMKVEGANEFMAAVREAGVDPVFDANWLNGYQFHMGIIKVVLQDKKEKDLIVPVAFLGVADAKPKGKAASKLAPKAAAKAKPAPAADDEEYGIDDEDIRNALIEAAKDAASFEDYSEAALDVDGVLGNKAYQKAAVSSKPGSIWATFGDA